MAGLGMRWIATGCAAVIFYVLSTSPMMALADSLHAPDDVRMAIGLTVYRPLLWWGDAFDTVPFLRWYDRAWH
jgi:hypothetical protein